MPRIKNPHAAEATKAVNVYFFMKDFLSGMLGRWEAFLLLGWRIRGVNVSSRVCASPTPRNKDMPAAERFGTRRDCRRVGCCRWKDDYLAGMSTVFRGRRIMNNSSQAGTVAMISKT